MAEAALVRPDQQPGYTEVDKRTAGLAYELGGVLLAGGKPGEQLSKHVWTVADRTYALSRGVQDDGETPCGFFTFSVSRPGMPQVDFTIGPTSCHANNQLARSPESGYQQDAPTDPAKGLFGSRFGALPALGISGILLDRIRQTMVDTSKPVELRRRLAHWLFAFEERR